MRIVGLTFTAALLGLVAAGAQAPATTPAAGQKPATQKPAPPRPAAIPRTGDGKPNLQGNWTNATITPNN